MPRLISEIKDPKLRKLAELRREEDEPKTLSDCLGSAFVWQKTKEQHFFWATVEMDLITELPKDHPLYDEL